METSVPSFDPKTVKERKDKMRQVANWCWSWRMACVMASAVVILTMAEPVASQSYIDTNSSLIRHYCSSYTGSNNQYFLANLNSTLSNLRRQLSTNQPPYAVARTLINGEALWGLAICRYYVSIARCLTCFDAAVVSLRVCGLVNGAHAYFENCDLRYENNNFYQEIEPFDNVIQCSNDTTSSSQPTPFRRAVDGLLSDIRKATPKTSNYYAASTRQIAGSNTSVYAFAQCYLNLSQSICAECLQNRYTTIVGCLPGTYGKALDMGCIMRYSAIPFFRDNQTTDIRPFLEGNSRKKRAIIGGIVGGVCFLLLVVVAFLLWHRRSRKSSDGQKGKSNKVGIIAGAIGGVEAFSLVVVAFLWYRLRKKSNAAEDTTKFEGAVNYNYKDLQLATNNFSNENRIGKGGFGEVFKAIVDGKNIVAVKKLQDKYGMAKAEFENEKLVSKVCHKNLIRLLGWSSEGSELLIVLEYMPKGSLDQHLWGGKKGTLNWKQRYDIIYGIASGLAYLHDEFHAKIVHRDIKSSNILLDNDFQPKIADFGLARFQPRDLSHVSTTFAGTLGYAPPEYVVRGRLSEKVDTYSYGIVVLEIISGRRCNDVNSGGPYTDCLLEHVWKLYENNMHKKLIDETIDPNEYEEEHVTKIIEIALSCTQSPVSTRPTMSEVFLMLSSRPSLGERQLTRPRFHCDRRIDIGS